jgi:two-component SAPR family response regulator
MPVLQSMPFDVLFCDIALPDASGCELAAQAARVAPQIRAIFVSGDGELPVPDGDMDAVLLPKPYDLLQLQAGLDDLMLPSAKRRRAARNS